MSLSNGMPHSLILGAGGHAKVLIEAIRSTQQEVNGVITLDLGYHDDFMGVPVLGGDEIIFEYDPQEVLLINGVGSLPRKYRRWHLSSMMRKNGYKFGSVIHITAIVAEDVMLAEGVQLMAGVTVQPGSKIGLDTIINTGSLIDHDTIIGDCCHIAPGVTLSGCVSVGNSVHIGTGAQVIQGVSIGNNVIIAAGTTVYSDIPDGMMVKQQAELNMEAIKGQ